MARFTKKELLTHFEDRFFTVEFYHGQRETFFGGQNIVSAIQTQLNCTKRGGVCFLFDQKYSHLVWKHIESREQEIKYRIPLDEFRSSMPGLIKEIDASINLL